jgi:hypothetical protein
LRFHEKNFFKTSGMCQAIRRKFSLNFFFKLGRWGLWIF